MLFPTFTFMLGFLPLTALVYFLLAKKSIPAARVWLVIASFVFYSWFNWSYSLILAASILINWFFAQCLYKKSSKIVLTLGIICNVLLLGYFKYYDFFVENINAVFGTSFLLKHILLPLGISFFTFQQISFLMMVNARQLAKRYTFGSYSLFVCFFPQLIAGPIVLPDEMMSQFDREENSKFNAENFAAGLYIFALGLGKKVLLADFFAEIADAGFAALAGNFFASWQTALAYTFQIYFDFSGYCDMAIGIGLLFNIRLPKNFDAPYRAENISDFWRRWHITLGRFLMSSIYIPLGGNRCGKLRTCWNLLVTFFISGLWHGASWLFVLWGMLHGFALVIHRVWSKFLGLKMPKLAAQLLTFFFVLLAWIPFRAANWSQAQALYLGMFHPASWQLPKVEVFNILLFIAGIFIIICLKPASDMKEKFRPTWVNALTATALIVVSMFFFVKYSPFIYFNF
ncbi:MAG: MBOAT family protein [Lentisphaerae bacterium]|nr:MBOAT family protein [Lentisphaerota bacterium]